MSGRQASRDLPPMLALALDSCGAETTLALLRDDAGAPAAMREVTLAARTAGSRLTGAMRELLADTPLHALAAILVVRGPGSFTGMRIGLSAAKALSEATGKPIAAVSRLAVLAGMAQAPAAALDAGRGRLYLALPGSHRETNEQLVSVEEAAALLTERRLAQQDVAVCEARACTLLPGARLVAAPSAVDAARFAWPRLLRGDWDDAAALDAHYLWRAEQMLRGGGAR